MKGIPITLNEADINYARKFVNKNHDETEEFAALSGSYYQFGGRGAYYLSRAMHERKWNIHDSNILFKGFRVQKRDEIYTAEVSIRPEERAAGFIWYLVAVGPVKQTEQGPKCPTIICGWILDDNTTKGAEMKIAVGATNTPPPNRWKHKNGSTVDWERRQPFSVTKQERPWGHK
jgi:hypothetical protein